MSVPQRVVLIFAALLVSVMALMPPWRFVYDFPGDEFHARALARQPAYKAERFAGYYAIWQSNTPTDQTYLADLFSIPIDDRSGMQYFSMKIDKDKLWIQLGVTLIVTALLVVILKPRNVAHS